jgi:hypothetical protein
VTAPGFTVRPQTAADEAWMALVLDPDAVPAGGVVRLRPEFDTAE